MGNGTNAIATVPPAPRPRPRLSRRAFLRRAGYALGATLAGGAASWWYGSDIEPALLETVRVQVALPRLPGAFEGLKIAQISDLHLGPSADRGIVHAAVDEVLRLKPDLAVVTGDYVNAEDTAGLRADQLEMALQELTRLSAPLGVLGILGNHDRWKLRDVVSGAVQKTGIGVLRNSNVRIQINGEAIYVAGVDDVWEKRSDLRLALRDVPDGACTILLVHEPDFADEASRDPRLVLQLSGHSHGGQVRLPGGQPLFLPELGRKYPQGLRQVGEMWLYTNRGIGVVPPPVRLNCRPEVTLIELVHRG